MAEIAEEFETGGAKQTFKELFSGAAGGVAQVLIGEWGFVLDVELSLLFIFERVDFLKLEGRSVS